MAGAYLNMSFREWKKESFTQRRKGKAKARKERVAFNALWSFVSSLRLVKFFALMKSPSGFKLTRSYKTCYTFGSA
jgi:hypothetical protein